MYQFIQTLHAVASLMCAAMLAVVVLDPRIREGFTIKLGLVLMVVGLAASGFITLKGFDTDQGLWNASLLLRSGLLLVIGGGIWKTRGE